MSSLDQDYIGIFFKEYIFGVMYNDIRRTIDKAKANFLVALGLFSYTEIMGGFVTGHLRDFRWSKRNFEAFLPYLGTYYNNLNQQIDLYTRVRCGLVHEYFIKGRFMIAIKCMHACIDQENRRGVYYDRKLDHIIVAVENYFQDFKAGVQRFYEILKSDNPEAVRKFMNAVRFPSAGERQI